MYHPFLDIDECSGKDGSSLCTDPKEYCSNTPGGFECERKCSLTKITLMLLFTLFYDTIPGLVIKNAFTLELWNDSVCSHSA